MSTDNNTDNDTQCIRPAFALQEVVSHVLDDSTKGIVVAFMMRGNNHSYEVQWNVDKCTWHLDFELAHKPEGKNKIGFWPQYGAAHKT